MSRDSGPRLSVRGPHPSDKGKTNMTKNDTAQAIATVDDFDVASSDYRDEAEMTVIVNDKPTNWKWRFAGPGHPQTVAYNERRSRERIHREAMQEQARVNGKKWRADEQTTDEVRADNVEWILSRLLGWSPVKMNGEDYPFSRENAKTLLLDQRKPFFGQAVEFLADEKSFMQRSATT
jgi:hypothetical protein